MRKIGRIKGGAPAVYVGYGYGLSVSSLDNGLIAGEWLGEDETASKMPLPLQSECDGAHAALFKMQSVVLARDACAASRQEILEMYEAAVKELAGLREFVDEEAEGDCHYGDNCPSNAGTRHGTCRSCKARQVLSALENGRRP
jgi:hypothetical protein